MEKLPELTEGELMLAETGAMADFERKTEKDCGLILTSAERLVFRYAFNAGAEFVRERIKLAAEAV